MRSRRYGKVLPVRLPNEVEERLKEIARIAGISKSSALRMAVAHGLPDLESGRIKFDLEVVVK